jgi:hypothetical protein
MVMVSIIQGLGITLALRGISHLVRSPLREPVVLLWAVFLVFVYLQNWWAFWDLAALDNWTIIKFLLIALYVCSWYAMTELMLPMASSPDTDWLEHFNRVRKWFFGMLVFMAPLGVLLGWYLGGVPLLHPYRIMQLIVFSLAIVGWFTSSISVHRWIVVLTILLVFGAQLLFRLFPHLSG